MDCTKQNFYPANLDPPKCSKGNGRSRKWDSSNSWLFAAPNRPKYDLEWKHTQPERTGSKPTREPHPQPGGTVRISSIIRKITLFSWFFNCFG